MLNTIYWDYDSDKKCFKDENNKDVCIDYKEINSDKFPQSPGDFEIWIPCKPARVACCVPLKDEDGTGEVYDSLCPQDYYKGTCENVKRGEAIENNMCLNGAFYGVPAIGGGSAGKCSSGGKPDLACAHDQVRMNITHYDCKGGQSSYVVTGNFIMHADGWVFSTGPEEVFGTRNYNEHFFKGYSNMIAFVKVDVGCFGAKATNPDGCSPWVAHNLGPCKPTSKSSGYYTYYYPPSTSTGNIYTSTSTWCNLFCQTVGDTCCAVNQVYGEDTGKCFDMFAGLSYNSC